MKPIGVAAVIVVVITVLIIVVVIVVILSFFMKIKTNISEIITMYDNGND